MTRSLTLTCFRVLPLALVLATQFGLAQAQGLGNGGGERPEATLHSDDFVVINPGRPTAEADNNTFCGNGEIPIVYEEDANGNDDTARRTDAARVTHRPVC